MTRTDIIVDRVVVEPGIPALVIGGTGPVRRAALIGPRQTIEGELSVDGERWSATLPLRVSRWGGPALAPRSGDYRLELTAEHAAAEVRLDAAIPPAELIEHVARLSFPAADGCLVVRVGAPLTDRERGPQQQAAREADYRAADYSPANAVFFESFFGRNASCNPRGIDGELARVRPDVTRYWSIADASVEVPPGALGVIEGSQAWWDARGSARVLIVNDWLRKRLRKRPYQTVVQTWHGTPLKKLALNRRRPGLRAMVATLRERARWDIMLAQNEHSRRVFRSAYAFRGPIWEEGYPRDDVLAGADPGGVRRRLGIPQTATVLLYAPTWRDDHPERVDHLDVARLAGELGDDHVILLRGHSRTLQPATDVRAERVIDVTGYPDVSELFLAADALITDYSSVMFDFTVTGKPIFFFTPDVQHYRDDLRGFYFDLLSVAPGPVVQTFDELLGLLRSMDAADPAYADRYAAWRERFNPLDDGHAAQRVVQRLLQLGVLPD